MNTYKIPKDFLPGFRLMINIGQEEWDQLCKVVSEIPEGTGPGKLQEYISEAVDVKEVELLSSTVFSLGSLLADGGDQGKIAEGLTRAYIFQLGEKGTEGGQQRLQDRLTQLLGCITPLVTTFQALNLMSESDRVFKDLRIVSDIRLLFDNPLSSKNRKALIVHNVRIGTKKGDDDQNIFLSCNRDGLEEIKKHIDRALEKEDQIKNDYGDQFPFIEITE